MSNEAAFQAQNETDILIHRVFAQSDSGAALLEIFKHSLMVTPGDRNGGDLYALGKEEGRKEFIRNIVLTINKIEKDD